MLISNCGTPILAARDKGPLALFLKGFPGLLIAVVLVWMTGYSLGWFQEVAEVTQEELGPRALLQKQEEIRDCGTEGQH